MKFTPGLTYENPRQLFKEHGQETPAGYAQEAYDRTPCGVSTRFLLADGGSVMSFDLGPDEDTIFHATRHFVGVQHGAIVEGGPGEWMADPLLFPFSDEELAEAWQYLEDATNREEDEEGEDPTTDQLREMLATLDASCESAAVTVAEHIRTLVSNGPEYATRSALIEEAESLAQWANRFADLVREQGD
jgi:hypothetical protein